MTVESPPKRRWRFPLRWLLWATILIAVCLALYAAFPRQFEFAGIIVFIVCAFIAELIPSVREYVSEKKPWISFLFCFLGGTWMLLVGLFRSPEARAFLVMFGSLMYAVGAFFLLVWFRRRSKRSP